MDQPDEITWCVRFWASWRIAPQSTVPDRQWGRQPCVSYHPLVPWISLLQFRLAATCSRQPGREPYAWETKNLIMWELFLCKAADWGVFSSVLLQQLNFVVALPRLMVIAPPIASMQALALQLGLLMLVIDLSYIAGRKVLFIFK